MAVKHRWTFFRAGGFDQVKLESGVDLMNLDSLDQKLWVALACPTRGLEIDARTLELIDSDKDGRVRADELTAAVRFAGQSLKNPDELLKGSKALALADINDSTPEGKSLLSSARQILRNIGKVDAQTISVEDVSDPTRIFTGTAFNGDGKITESSTDDEGLKTAIREVMECVGSVADLSGQAGIDAEKVDAFFAEAKALHAWFEEGEADAAKVFPLGREAAAEGFAAIAAIRAKVDDYFGRCRLIAFDNRAEAALNRQPEEYLAIGMKELNLSASEVSAFPLARAAAGQPLPLRGKVNPAHVDAVSRFRDTVIAPILGARDELSESDWLKVLETFTPYMDWMGKKPGARVEKLGVKRVNELLSGNVQASLMELIAKDKALESETANIEKVEKLVRFHRDIALLCTNFVNFKDFYDGEDPAVFQAGTLYLDQRACRLCLRVEDPAKHATMAGLAGAYLAYLDCSRVGEPKMQIVAAFTAGDGDNLMAGRNGIFYDRKGRDWDATIVKIVDNPISIGQAFWSPYKKFVRYLEEQVTKRAAVADAEAHDNLAATASTAANIDKTKPALVPKKIDVGTVAAIGVAAGAIGTFATALIGYATGVFKLGFLPTLAAIVGLVGLISMPAVVMAYIKLRKRNLGPILDANGWAVNAKAKINVPFGATLSSVAKLPPGSKRDSGDRYAEKGFPWKTLIGFLVLLYLAFRWYSGSFDHVLPGPMRSIEVLGKWAPHASAPLNPNPKAEIPASTEAAGSPAP